MSLKALIYISLLPLFLPSPLWQNSKTKSPYILCDSMDWPTGIKDALPLWITQSSIPNTVIGISDPLLKPEIAKEQAIKRALALYSLQSGVKIQVFYDLFTSNKEPKEPGNNDYKHVIITKIALPYMHSQYTLLQEHRSRFGETFIQLHVQALNIAPQSTENNIEIMQVFTRIRHTYIDLHLSFNQTFSHDTLLWKDNFLLRQQDRIRISTYQINGVSLPSGRGKFNYTDIGENSPNSDRIGIPMFEGFWSAWIESLAKQIIQYDYTNNLNIKALIDQKNNKPTQSLTRQTVQTELFIQLQKVYTYNNYLFARWEIKETHKDY